MKYKFSKRWLTNFLIVALGLVILVIAILASLNLWFVGANDIAIYPVGVNYPQKTFQSSSQIPKFDFTTVQNVPFLEVYDKAVIDEAFGNLVASYPGYKLTYFVSSGGSQPTSGYYAVVPLLPFSYLNTANTTQYGYQATESSAGLNLLIKSKEKFSAENGFNNDLVGNSIKSYQQAVKFSNSSARIVGDTLYINDPELVGSYQNDDPDVLLATSFGLQPKVQSLSVSIASGAKYKDPIANSLAERILKSGVEEAVRLDDTVSKQKIQLALDNYKKQSSVTTQNGAFYITSDENINFGASETVKFGVDNSKLSLPAGKSLATLMLNIDSVNICKISIGASGASDCSWSGDSGSYTWNTKTPSGLGTDHSAKRTLTFKAYWKPQLKGENNLIGTVNKSVAILPKGGTGDSTNSDLGITITAPNAVNRAADQQIFISANLDKIRQKAESMSPKVKFKYLTWYVCKGNQQTISAAIEDRTLCGQKGLIENSGSSDLSSKTGTISAAVSWDASGTALGDHVIMVKAFGEGDPHPYVVSSKTVSSTVIVTAAPIISNDGGSVPMAVFPPAEIDKSKDSAKRVKIRITAANLNPSGVFGADRVGAISWYVCKGSQQAILANDSTGCAEKGTFGPFAENSVELEGEWDASGSEVGTHVIMVKAFKMKVGDKYPDYPGATKVVSSNIAVTDSTAGGSGGGSGGSKTGTVGDGPPAPDWAAQFAASKTIKTITDLIHRVGSFTMLILGILAVIAIIIAGMKYISSGGDPKKAEAGKKALLFAIYGIIAAVLCVMLVKTTITEVEGIIGKNEWLSTLENPGSLLNGSAGSCNGVDSITFAGPCAGIDTITNRDTGIIWRFIMLAVYYAEAVAVFYILYASFLYLTSYGDESKAESAKKTLIWSIIGIAFILSANFLLNIFAGIIL